MRRVQQAVIAPYRCAVIPFMGNSTASGFIDTGMDLIGVDPHVYISFEAGVEIAKELGWVGPSERRDLQAQIASLTAKVDQLEKEVKEADKFAESAEYTLAKFGTKVQKKPGRKPKEEVKA